MTDAAFAMADPRMGAVSDLERGIRRVLPVLRRYAQRLTRNAADAEDLVQETLCRAWAARERFKPDTNLKSWLFRIQYNCFISGLRKSRRLVPLSPAVAETRLVAPAMQEEHLMMRDLERGLATLTDDQTAALALANDPDLRYEDVADRLGIDVGTAKSRVSRARAALPRFFDREVEDSQGAVADRQGGSLGKHRTVPAPGVEPSRYAAWKASGSRLIG